MGFKVLMIEKRLRILEFESKRTYTLLKWDKPAALYSLEPRAHLVCSFSTRRETNDLKSYPSGHLPQLNSVVIFAGYYIKVGSLSCREISVLFTE